MGENDLEAIGKALTEWERKSSIDKVSKRYTSFGEEIKVAYTPLDVAGKDYLRDVGLPGEYPCTRSAYPLGHRGRLWTLRQYAGFGTPAETNERFKWLFKEGNTGLNIAFDLVTQAGYDSDNLEYGDEVGRVGVAIDSLEDFETMFDGLDLAKVSSGFTINAVAPIIVAMYVALAEKQGIPSEKLTGTVQNDNLKEYCSRGAYVYPVGPQMRMTADLVEFCAKRMPKFVPISVCGYHIREAGASLPQELGYALLIAKAYIHCALERGLDIDSFAPRISFNMATFLGFFEEIAKYRAGRRMWARMLRDEFGAKDPKSWKFLYIAGSSGFTYSHTQPDNNIIRGTIEEMASIISGCNASAVHTKDEGHTIPTPESQRTALRTQQIIIHETDILSTVDPLAGSYFVESLTDTVERETYKVMEDIESRGGIVKCIEDGYVQAILARQAYEERRKRESGENPVVGENMFVEEDEELSIRFHHVDPTWFDDQLSRLRQLRTRRDGALVSSALDGLRRAASGSTNIMEPLVEACKAYATIGEMAGVLREVYGEFKEPVGIF